MLEIRQGLNYATIEQLINQRVAVVMAAYEANRSNKNANQNEVGGSAGGVKHTTQGCTYNAFLNCQPQNFDKTEGVVGLTRWFEKMKSVFYICNCEENCQTVRIDVAYEMTWKKLIKMMTEVYCPRNEIQKLKNELWNLTIKDNDVVGYTQRFQELALLCPKMVPNEEEKIVHLGSPGQHSKKHERDCMIQFKWLIV
nr:hypothetical protein [Tanacetum cinerariifolium]